MFLTDKYHSLLPIHSPAKDHRKAPAPGPASRFDAALAARLGSLLPLPASPLAALARLADLLAATLADAVPALGNGDAAAVAAHLDAGVALLDACNAIAARVDRLRRRRLLTRLAVHLLASSSPSSVQRARAALADRDGRGGAGASSPTLPLPSVPFVDPNKVGGGRQITAAARVLVAVNAVSSLAAAAAASILGGATSTLSCASFPLVITGDLPWAEAFNALSSQLAVLATAKTSEVDAVDEAISKLAAALDSCAEGEGGNAEDEVAVRAAAQEVEKRTEELAARLDRLSDAVNGVFRAALRLRNAEVGIFAVGPDEKTRSKK